MPKRSQPALLNRDRAGRIQNREARSVVATW